MQMDLWMNYHAPIYKYTKAQNQDLIDLLMNESEEKASKTEDQFRADTGLSKEQFNELLNEIPSLVSAFTDKNTAIDALTAYLTRLRTGHTYDQIRYSIGGIMPKTLRKYMEKVRTVLSTDFVPKYLGFENLSRECIVQNSTEMAKQLYCKRDDTEAVTIWDGTYIYCNKSQNHNLQRSTYSGQKLRNLVKPMICVTTNGTYIDIFGPFEAKENDAKIMENVFEKYGNIIIEKSNPGDVMLVDRGFRDCRNLLLQHGFDVKMPEFIQKDDKTGQLTTEKANASRLVTASI